MTAPVFPVGALLNERYRVTGILKQSPSASCYAVTTREGAPAAIKLFSPALTQLAERMSLLQQASAAVNALPNSMVAHVLDAGYEMSSGAPFMVSEWVAAPSLAELLRGRAFDPTQLGSLLNGLARAIESAHILQMPHQGLSPHNIFVVSEVAVRLTDFAARAVRAPLMTPDEIAESLPYLAPEQLSADATGDSSSDVYASGLIAFQSLTRGSLWRSSTLAPRTVSAWDREMHASLDIAGRAQELGVPLPAPVVTVFERVLAVSPADRLGSVRAFADLFNGALGQIKSHRVAGTLVGVGAVPPASPSGEASATADPSQPKRPARKFSGTMALDLSSHEDRPTTNLLGQALAAKAAAAAPEASASPAPRGGPHGTTFLLHEEPPKAPMAPGGGTAPAPPLVPPPPAAFVAATEAAYSPPPPMRLASEPAAPVAPLGHETAPLPQAYGAQAPMQPARASGQQPPVLQGEGAALTDDDPVELPTSRSNLMVLVVVGTFLVGALLTLLGYGALRLLRPSSHARIGSSPSASSSVSAAPTESASSPPSATLVASHTAPSESPAASTWNVNLTCDPECDWIKVDGHMATMPMTLPPGLHRVILFKNGYKAQGDRFQLAEGTPFSKSYELVPLPTHSGKRKPCGSFVNPCK